MKIDRWVLISAVGWLCLAVGLALTARPAPSHAQSTGTVSGVVSDEHGPVLGATVRIQATNSQTVTDFQGRFTLVGLHDGIPVTISAWKEGYYAAKAEDIIPPASDVTLTLITVQTNDNPDYEWIMPTGTEGSCASCKSAVTEIWLENSQHAQASRNPQFLTMYNGTDIEGNQSPLTRFGYSRDYGSFPLRPDPSLPYYGPGYKLDFPTTAGNCAACHTPGAALDAAYGTDPNTVTGADAFGVHCDFCHKIADVTLDPATGLPYPNMPGVLSLDVRRPFPDDPERYQLFFGTFDDDNVPEEDTYLPLIERSQFCAACHFGVFWDTVVYNSYGEWLDSPYSDPKNGKTCQECHMPSPSMLDGDILTNVAPDMGGVERNPLTIHAHLQPGAADQTLLQNTARLEVRAARDGDRLIVDAAVTNVAAGHHIPTDSPLRQIFLVVTATDEQDQPLELREGTTLPDWAGDLEGKPGAYFAKILQEIWTEIQPSGAYWNPTRIVEDTRLPALATHISSYEFVIPAEAEGVTVEAQLVFRRAFYDLMMQKGWDIPDILMEQAIVEILFDE
jgi:hypothetical protein